jgi:glycosyltransferase involved in cell wall biosynthesis
MKKIDRINIAVVIFNEGELAARLRSADVPVYLLDETRRSSLRIFVCLLQIMRDFRPDIVHTHRFKENVLGAVAVVIAGHGRLVRTLHGAPERLGAMNPAQRLLAALDRAVTRLPSYLVVSVSEKTAVYARKAFPSARHIVIWNGIDVESIRKIAIERRVGTDTRTKKIGLVGRLVPVKRIDLFLRIASILRGRHGLGVAFVIVGDGPELQNSRELARSLGLLDACAFRGHVPDSRADIASLDVLLITSDHEGLPMVALEALALGVTVVAHSVGGLPELLEPRTGGHLVKSQSAKEFADVIDQVLTIKTSDKAELPPSRLPSAYLVAHTAAAYAAAYEPCGAITAKPRA